MGFMFDGGEVNSPYVDVLWRTQSEGSGSSFMAVAESRWGIVITRQQGQTTFTMMGPETKASVAPIPEDAEFFGIIFKHGVFMPDLPTSDLVDTGIHLPASDHTFPLHGAAWEVPTFENADVFINRMVSQGLLTRDPIVQAVIRGEMQDDVSLRSVQRRFVRAAGISYTTIYQIERAKRAAALLEQGVAILDVVELTGYADQPHLTRAMRRFYGHTPAQMLGQTGLVKGETTLIGADPR